jgi:hypothetical protein
MTSTTAPARTAHRPAAPGGRLRRWRGSPPLTLLAVAMGVMMVGLDGTIIAVANPGHPVPPARRPGRHPVD